MRIDLMLIMGIAFVAVSSGILGYLIGHGRAMRKAGEVQKAVEDITAKWEAIVKLYREKQDRIPDNAKAHVNDAQKAVEDMRAIYGQAEKPSSSALHSRYKNDLKSQLVELDKSRINSLRLAVAAGYNPLVNSSGEKIRLSDMLDEQSKTHSNTNTKTPPNTKPTLKIVKTPNLRIVK